MTEKFARRAIEFDRNDPLAALRDRFHLPEDIIYLNGNSLGPMPIGVAERLTTATGTEWAKDLITSWNKADWIGLPRRISARISPLIGADSDCIAVTDSTSINLFKVLSAALAMRPGKTRIISERDNFPTDLYMAEGLSALMAQNHELVLAEGPEGAAAQIDDRAAVLMLTHVNYRTGRICDMAGLTRTAHDAGALTIWDLAHSAGAVEVDLAGAKADFAVGCGYKYLNGGPGAPAFIYAAREHHGVARQPLTGWFSHAAPFAFESKYSPASGIARFYTSTPPVLSLTALDAALDAWDGVSMADVRRKSLALTDFFIEAVETRCGGHGLTLASPRDQELRGSQVSFHLPEIGYAVIQALISRGVIGDFRAPDIIRFGFAPLYTRFADVAAAVEILAGVLSDGSWDQNGFRLKAAVT